MVPTRKIKRADLEASASYRLGLTKLVPETLADERLAQLKAFIQQLANTPTGLADLRCRARRFGTCEHQAGESAVQFYGRLRWWLDRDLDSDRDFVRDRDHGRDGMNRDARNEHS